MGCEIETDHFNFNNAIAFLAASERVAVAGPYHCPWLKRNI